MLLVLLLALIAPLLRAQELNIYNHCGYDIYYWVVGGITSERQTITPQRLYAQEYLVYDPVSHGKTIEISPSPDGHLDHSPMLQFAYTVPKKYHELWYQLVNANGSPFKGHRVQVLGETCPGILWENGEKTSDGIMYCTNFSWIELHLCQDTVKRQEGEVAAKVERAFEG